MTLQEYVQGLAKVTSELVGDRLSIAKGTNPIPSVFVGHQKPPKPLYPYSTTDYIGTGNYGAKEVYSGYDEGKGTYDSHFNRRIRLRVAFYGKYGDNVLDTSSIIAHALRTEKGRKVLKKYMAGAGIMSVSEPSHNDTLITTDFEEFCFITIDFWVISTISDRDFYNITSVNSDGSLYVDYDQQEPPLKITGQFQHHD